MHDIIIIGSGPAGYTAAIYASRAFLKTAVIDGSVPGGQLTTTTEVDNYPGFAAGIQGTELVENMKKQSARFGTEVISDIITGLTATDGKKSDRHFILNGTSKKYQTRSVIIATGASAKTMGLSSEEKFRGKGISYCATCDGFFFRGKDLAVLGGGDTAMEEATFLTKFAAHVTVIHRRDEFRASAIMLDRARKDTKISFLTNKAVQEFTGNTTVSGVKLKDVKTGEITVLPIGGAFVAIGHKPATEFLSGMVDLDRKGYIKVKSQSASRRTEVRDEADDENPLLNPQTETSVPGIFAAGDCVDPRYRQAIVAAGMGCMAAMDAEKWLDHQK